MHECTQGWMEKIFLYLYALVTTLFILGYKKEQFTVLFVLLGGCEVVQLAGRVKQGSY